MDGANQSALPVLRGPRQEMTVTRIGPEEGPMSVEQCRMMLWYDRESWKRQLGVYGDSVEIREWALEQGYVIATEAFYDGDASGLRAPEALPALSRALARIEEGEAAALGVIRQDRLCCDPGYFEAILRRVWDAGGQVYSYREGRFIDSYRSMLTYKERAAFHALERIHSQMRRADARRDRIDHRVYTGGGFGKVCYGFDLVPRFGVLRRVVNDAEQANIRHWCQLRTEGMTDAAIARQANADGIRTKRGNQWGRKTIGAVMDRGPYSGPRILGVTRTGGGTVTVGQAVGYDVEADTG